MPFFSVVICAYNVAGFLEKAVASVMMQESDFELIIVDDGSTDGMTPILCDKLAASDERIKIIHKPNGGLGSARNTGIGAASGEYIFFYDADDDISRNALVVLKDLLRSEPAIDVLNFSYREITDKYKTVNSYTFCDMLLRGDEICNSFGSELSGVRFNNGFVWNKIYRREFLNEHNLRFGNEVIQQDIIFNLQVFRVAKTMRLSRAVLYDYHVYDSGNNRSRYIPERLEIYKKIYHSYMHLVADWKLDDVILNVYVARKFVNDVVTYLTFNLFHPDCPLTAGQKRDEIRNVMSNADLRDCIHLLKGYGYKGCGRISRLYFGALDERNVDKFLRTRKKELVRRLIASVYWKIKKSFHA